MKNLSSFDDFDTEDTPTINPIAKFIGCSGIAIVSTITLIIALAAAALIVTGIIRLIILIITGA